MPFRFPAAVSAVTMLSATAITLVPDFTAASAATASPLPIIEAVLDTDRDQSLSLGTEAPAPLQAPAGPSSGANDAAPSAPDADANRIPLPASSLDALVDRYADSTAPVDAETRCLATAVFYEARGESLAGKLAVADVIVSRAGSGRFPSSLCGVVTQRGQFSFVRGGAMPSVNESHRKWRDSLAIARIAVDQAWDSPAEGALFFHARHVSPRWGKTQIAQVDNHIFYR